MKIRLSGNDILHDDFKGDMLIGQFEDRNLTDEAKQRFVNIHNCGADMLKIFEMRGHSERIDDVSAMLSEMRHVLALYREREYANKKKHG